MKKALVRMAIVLMAISMAQAQQAEIIKPILLNKSALSGVGLERIELKDEPEKEFYQKNLFWGDELGVFVVSTENWINEVKDYSFDEFIYMYHGQAEVRPANGKPVVFYSGDYFFAPKGFNGEWEIKGGDHLHYELSIITTKRADSSLVLKNSKHRLFAKSLLSGNDIILDKNGSYEEILEKGAELTVKLGAERPLEKVLEQAKRERFFHILSGQIDVIDAAGTEHNFYAGDFFIIRKGLTGTWKSKGHGLVKYLTVEKTQIDTI